MLENVKSLYVLEVNMGKRKVFFLRIFFQQQQLSIFTQTLYHIMTKVLALEN